MLLLAVMATPALAAPAYRTHAHAWYNDQGDIEVSGQYVSARPAPPRTTPLQPAVRQTTQTLSGAQLFRLDSARLATPSASLKTLAERLRRGPSRTVIITGYTDDTGSAAYNIHLSTRRAMSILHYLSGVAPQHHYTATGVGEASPVTSNHTRAGRELNRRVTVSVMETPQ